MTPNPAFERTAASALRLLAVPSSLRSSAAAQRERWASRDRHPTLLILSPHSALSIEDSAQCETSALSTEADEEA
jgi:hypothetical protein